MVSVWEQMRQGQILCRNHIGLFQREEFEFPAIRQIRSLIRNQSGQLAKSAFGRKLSQRIPQVKQELRANFADEYPPDSLEEWLKRLFEPYEAMFAGLGMFQEQSEV